MSGTTAGAEDNDYERSGPYIGAAGTWALYTSAENRLEEDLPSAKVDNPLGVNGRAGYRMNSFFAAEVEFEWLAESNVESSGLGVAGLDTWSVTANAKGFILTRLMHDLGIARLQPFALAGVGLMRSKIDDKADLDLSAKNQDFAVRVGAGLDLYITRNILGSLEVGWVLPTQGLRDLDYVSFSWGLQYRF